MDCYAYLRERGGIINYRLTETWLREYQVRFHNNKKLCKIYDIQ